jgi:phenylpyruvate tautomerase PptA (4-oxalocrotonate tautomerase family)
LAELSKVVAGAVGKPEQYVMITVSHSATLMSGKAGEAAFVDIRSIGGLNDETNRKLSQQICKLLKDSLGIAPDRVYLNFTDVEAGNWGWNGSTFG